MAVFQELTISGVVFTAGQSPDRTEIV